MKKTDRREETERIIITLTMLNEGMRKLADYDSDYDLLDETVINVLRGVFGERVSLPSLNPGRLLRL